MIAARTLQNEAERLEVLRAFKILDTDPEESFDRLAWLATMIFDVPIAHVSLVAEHREWFKARCGGTRAEGDRRTAFCAHVVAAGEVLVVEDTLEDERFRDNPYVTGSPAIRFYAGAPLQCRRGLTIGAICIKDHTPRRFTERDAPLHTAIYRPLEEGLALWR